MNSLDENLYQDEESELGFPFFGQNKISEIVNKNQEEADKERKKDIFYIKHIKKKYKKIEIKNYRNKKKIIMIVLIFLKKKQIKAMKY